MSPRHVSRRRFLQSAAMASAASVIPGVIPDSSVLALRSGSDSSHPIHSGALEEFGYGDVTPHGWLPHLITLAMMATILPLFAAALALITTGLVADHVDKRHDELKRHVDQRHEELKRHLEKLAGHHE